VEDQSLAVERPMTPLLLYSKRSYHLHGFDGPDFFKLFCGIIHNAQFFDPRRLCSFLLCPYRRPRRPAGSHHHQKPKSGPW